MKPLGRGGKFTIAPGSRTRNKISQGNNLPSISARPASGDLHIQTYTKGPRVLGIGIKPENISGPGEPPEGFVRGSTSLSEWILYWALTKILGPEGDVWEYQQSMQGGRHLLGGAVVDFVIYQGAVVLGIRLQTYRFHLSADAKKQATDLDQFLALSGPEVIIIDVFEDDIIKDETGQAAIRIVLDIINRRERINPLASGFVVGTG